MNDIYEYTDRDGDQLAVQTVDYDGVPYAALGILATDGRVATVHVDPNRAWEVCEAILEAAGVDAEEDA